MCSDTCSTITTHLAHSLAFGLKWELIVQLPTCSDGIQAGGIQAVRMSGRRELEFVSMALLQW